MPDASGIEAEIASQVAGIRSLCEAIAHDMAAMRLRLEEISGKRAAPPLDPEAERKDSEAAEERERQREEAFKRMRAEKGKDPDLLDDDDIEELSSLWMTK